MLKTTSLWLGHLVMNQEMILESIYDFCPCEDQKIRPF